MTKQITIQDFYPAGLKKAMNAYNAELLEIQAERAKLSADADALKRNAADGTLKKPGRLASDVSELQARRTELDQKELVLIQRKATFQSQIDEARLAEHARLLKLADGRMAELNAGLDAIGSDSRYRPGLIATDTKLSALNAAAREFARPLRVAEAEDKERFAVLSARLAGSVPEIEA